MAVIIDGRAEANLLKQHVHAQVTELRHFNKTPGLAVILVGTDPASQVYVTAKCRQATEVGIRSFKYELPESITQVDLLDHIQRLNQDDTIHGILIQLPLPAHLETQTILQAVNPRKDVDGLHPENVGLLASNHPYMVPCTPLGCMHLLKKYAPHLRGLKAVIIGASRLIGRPLAQLLLNEDCTVTITHKYTQDIQQECASADILIAAAGVPHLVTKSWVKPGAIVLDIGINRVTDATGVTRLIGDVAFEEVSQIAAAITPVPGGVGPMTVACLLENTLKAAHA